MGEGDAGSNLPGNGRDFDEAICCEEVVRVVLNEGSVNYIAVGEYRGSTTTSWSHHHPIVLGDDAGVKISETLESIVRGFASNTSNQAVVLILCFVDCVLSTERLTLTSCSGEEAIIAPAVSREVTRD